MLLPFRRRAHVSSRGGALSFAAAGLALAAMTAILTACSPTPPPTLEPPARSLADLHVPAMVGLWALTVSDLPLDDSNILGVAVSAAGGTPATAVHAEVKATAPDGRTFLFDVIDAPGATHDGLAAALSRELAPGVVATTRAVGRWGLTSYDQRGPTASTLWVATRGSRSVILLADDSLTPAEVEALLGAL